MSKIINEGLNLSGTGCFIHMATVGVKGVARGPSPSPPTIRTPVMRWIVYIAEQRKVQGVALADSAATSHVSNRTTSRDTSRKSFAPVDAESLPEFSSSSSSRSAASQSRGWFPVSLMLPAAAAVVAMVLSVTSFVT